jgi:hypothetical protein
MLTLTVVLAQLQSLLTAWLGNQTSVKAVHKEEKVAINCVTFRWVGETKLNGLYLYNIKVIFFVCLWGYWHCCHSWPFVPASGDSEDDCGEADGM